MRIAVFVVHPSTLLRYLLYSVFAFRSCLIVRFDGDLTIHEALGILGGFGLGVYVGWEDAVHLSREFGGELGASDQLDVWRRRGLRTFFQNSSTLLWGSCFLTLMGDSCTDCGAGWEFSKSAASPGSLMLLACAGSGRPC